MFPFLAREQPSTKSLDTRVGAGRFPSMSGLAPTQTVPEIFESNFGIIFIIQKSGSINTPLYLRLRFVVLFEI